jgi:hypothetical protein
MPAADQAVPLGALIDALFGDRRRSSNETRSVVCTSCRRSVTGSCKTRAGHDPTWSRQPPCTPPIGVAGTFEVEDEHNDVSAMSSALFEP